MITSNIKEAVKNLNNGDIVAIPTETVYGLAGNAYDEIALKKIFTLKQRPLYNPLIVHVRSLEYLKNVATDIPDEALELAKFFWPGPLTLLLKKKSTVSAMVTAGKPTVAVRIPAHPVALTLLNELDFPLAAPSANPFGSISPTTSIHVENYFNNELLVLEGGNCQRGLESTIIGFENNKVKLYRHGAISIDEIEKLVGTVSYKTAEVNNPEAPGMLSRHYAPSTKTILTNNVVKAMRSFSGHKIGLLLFFEKKDIANVAFKEVLSESADLSEASSNLYSALHRLDKMLLDVIIVELFPEEGLGITINDRLRRAAKSL